NTRSKRDWSSDVCSSDLSMVGDVGKYQQIEMTDGIASGKVQGGGAASDMAGMMMGMNVAKEMMQNMNENTEQQQNQQTQTPTQSASANGGEIPNFCPNCGTKTSGGNFCSNCGQKLV